MKKNYIVLSIAVVLIGFVIFCFCYKNDISQEQYIKDESNYITVTGTVSYLSFNDDRTVLHIALTDLSEKLDDNAFKVFGENLKVLQQKNIEQKLSVGMNVSITTAPKYFGDGYVFPVAALVVDGDELLDFETGLKNIREQDE
ncbi:MAG: hypothetical protein E7523_01310 [Ruminococcaceae bacterium]|nr:hypothetical protein [Oscillospiraceae bacterium]